MICLSQVVEPPQRNSGVVGGKFLRRDKHRKTEGGWFCHADFYVGAVIPVHGWKFELLDADERTRKITNERGIGR